MCVIRKLFKQIFKLFFSISTQLFLCLTIISVLSIESLGLYDFSRPMCWTLYGWLTGDILRFIFLFLLPILSVYIRIYSENAWVALCLYGVIILNLTLASSIFIFSEPIRLFPCIKHITFKLLIFTFLGGISFLFIHSLLFVVDWSRKKMMLERWFSAFVLTAFYIMLYFMLS